MARWVSWLLVLLVAVPSAGCFWFDCRRPHQFENVDCSYVPESMTAILAYDDTWDSTRVGDAFQKMGFTSVTSSAVGALGHHENATLRLTPGATSGFVLEFEFKVFEEPGSGLYTRGEADAILAGTQAAEAPYVVAWVGALRDRTGWAPDKDVEWRPLLAVT